MKRVLGKSGIEVAAVGMGCWAIGGKWTFLGNDAGWGDVDDAESIRAIHAALEHGANFFDTAANYGAGHSERILAQALKGRREQAVIATKTGYEVDEAGKAVRTYGPSELESNPVPYLRADLERSLRRLDTDTIDVYLLHVGGLAPERALEVGKVLEQFRQEGKIRTFGWSTDWAEALFEFCEGTPGASVLEQALNVFTGSDEIVAFAERHNLGNIVRAPLGMGVLTGRMTPETTFAEGDVRRKVEWFPGIKDGHANQEWLDRLAAIREVMTSGGRTLAQGALAWIWGRSPNTVPIPGFRTVAQVEENAKAMEFGPLTPEQMTEIDRILGREPVLGRA